MFEVEQAAQRGQLLRLIVYEAGVLLEDVVSLGARRVLQLEHSLRIEEVHLTLTTPLILATEFELAMGTLLGAGGMCVGMSSCDLDRHFVDSNATKAAHDAGEILVHQLLSETDRLEDLRSGVRRNGAHAHLRHHLQHALATGLDEVLHGLARVHPAEPVEIFADHVLDRFEREIRVDRSRAEPDEEGHVMHLASVTTLHDQSSLRALLLADQMMMHGGGQQQRRNGCEYVVAVAVAEHDDARTVGNGFAHL